MQVLVQIHYIYNDIKVLKKCDLKVNPQIYKENPDEAAAEVAKKWIRQLQKDSPGMEIDQVLYSITDITDLIH